MQPNELANPNMLETHVCCEAVNVSKRAALRSLQLLEGGWEYESFCYIGIVDARSSQRGARTPQAGRLLRFCAVVSAVNAVNAATVIMDFILSGEDWFGKSIE